MKKHYKLRKELWGWLASFTINGLMFKYQLEWWNEKYQVYWFLSYGRKVRYYNSEHQLPAEAYVPLTFSLVRLTSTCKKTFRFKSYNTGKLHEKYYKKYYQRKVKK